MDWQEFLVSNWHVKVVCVLLIWAAAAAVRGVKLKFANPPQGLQALAHLCDVEPLLGLA